MSTLKIILFSVLGLSVTAQASLDEFYSICKFSNPFYQFEMPSSKWDELEKHLKKSKDAAEAQSSLQNEVDFRVLGSIYFMMGDSTSNEKDAVAPEYPRKIFFDGTTIMGVTSHPKFADLNNQLPLFLWDAEKKIFLTKMIDYRVTPPKTIDSPKSCNRCHGNPPAPNWAAYRIWPGVYRQSESFFSPGGKDKEKLPPGYDTLRKNPEERLKGILGSQLAKSALSNEDEMATFFGAYLNNLNMQRLATQMMKQDTFKKNLPAVIAALLDCKELEKFASQDKEKQAEAKKALTKQRLEVEDSLKSQYEKKVKRAKAQKTRNNRDTSDADFKYVGNVGLNESELSAAIQFFVGNNKFDLADYSLDHEIGETNYAFHSLGTEEGGLHSLLCYLAPELAKQKENEELVKLIAKGKKSCDELRNKQFPPPVPKSTPLPAKKDLPADEDEIDQTEPNH